MGLKDELQNLRNRLLGKSNHSNSGRTTVVKPELTEEEKKMLESVGKFNEGFKSPAAEAMANHFASIRNISLDAKVDDYIEWNYENMVKGYYTDIGEYWVPIELRNFIEKMAVWYELRYPDYEINRLMPGSGQEGIEVSDVMFNSNNYINELFDENADVRAIDWDDFYNTHAFIKSLPWEERYRFQRARYKDLVYLDPNYTLHSSMEVERKTAHLHLTSNGFVKEAEGVDCYSKFKVTNEELKGMQVKEVVELLKERGITLPSDNELESTINNVEKFIKEKEGMLDAVMYRIIERGGNRMGPRRGFLFAKEFGRNIDIPMMYAIDRSDPGLRLFINEYIKAGGSKDLICYIGYFSRTNKSKKLDTISIQDLILTQNNNAATFYTPEETALHQRMVNAISSQINQEKVRKEEVKQLRLQRKLEKSRKKSN